MNQPLELSTVKPSYEDIVDQLNTLLITNDAWKELLTAGTGQTFLEAIGIIGAYEQAAIERGFHETFLDTARLQSSILSISRMLGVHLTRKKPVHVKVDLQITARPTILVIPAYSQFRIRDKAYFNNYAIVFNVGQTSITGVDLYEGEVGSEQFVSTGDAFQRFEIGPEDFSLSDDHLICYVDGTEYTKVLDGLWNYTQLSNVFYENTKTKGNVEIIFGNNSYGKIPPPNSTIVFIYARTLGSDHDVLVLDDPIGCAVVPDLVGQFKSIESVGDNQRTKEYYKVMSPFIRAAQDRMVSPSDHSVLTVNKYAGVLDAKFIGQRDIDPTNKEYMNVIQCALLTTSSWTNQQWLDFKRWAETYLMISCELRRVDPVSHTLDIEADVYCANEADLTKVKAKIEESLVEYFKIRYGSLGYSHYLSDIHDHILKVDPLIKFNQILAPTTDLVIGSLEYIQLGTVVINMYYTDRRDLV